MRSVKTLGFPAFMMEQDSKLAAMPVEVPVAAPVAVALGWKRPLLVVLVLAAASVGGGYWWMHRPPGLPLGIAFGNGRLEADEIDIDTKFAGRVARLDVDEGDVVVAGQVVGLMDSQDLEASLGQARALVLQAEHTVQQAMAALAQQRTVVVLARQQLDRSTTLARTGFETRETVDTRQQALAGALQTVNADIAAAGAAAQALVAAQQEVVLGQVNIGYNTLVAPRAGTIEYRIAHAGEVLPAGGKLFTLLDRGNVYMDVFLSTRDAGRALIGAPARIVLDAYPDRPIEAAVSYVAAQAQFTPKTVETKDERDSLMFRVRVRIAPAVLAALATPVKSGLPGLAYVRTDATTVWPAALQGQPAK